MNRWMVVVGAIMIQVALGAIYAWSAFTGALQGPDYGFTKTQTQAIFSAGLASFAVCTIIGGRLQQKKLTPKTTAIAGGVLLGIGYILGGMVGDNYIAKLLFIGVIGGAGIGLAYVVPIGVGIKWFPDKKGLVSGLAVAGFGFGAFIWILAANPPSVLGFNGLITDLTIETVDKVFMIYGIAFLALVVMGSMVMVNPPEGWKPEGWVDPSEDEPKTKKGKKQEKKKLEFSPKEMLRNPQFYILWTMFIVGALAGLMVIGNIKNFAVNPTDGFESHGFSATQAADYAVIGAAVCLPILNGAGRIVWGQVSDKIGRKKAFLSMFAFQGVMMAVFFYSTSSPLFFYAIAAMIGFNFGGNFALFPAATADTFGAKSVGSNYGYVFTAYGVGGIAGPIMAGWVQDAGLSFTYAFYPAAVMCFVAAILAFFYNPKQKSTE